MATAGDGPGGELDPGGVEPVAVLHVDAEPGFAERVAASIERADLRFTVHAETDPAAALDRIREDPPDAVLSGFRMPGMDGVELLRSVREIDPSLPFVLFTGSGSESVVAAAVTAGVTDYLRKEPGTDSYDDLARRLGDAVDRHRTELAVEHRSRLFDALYADPHVFGAVLDPDGEVRRVDEGFASTDGTTDRHRGKRFWDLPWFHEGLEGLSDVERRVARAAAGESVQFFTPCLVDGEERATLELLVPVEHDDETEILALGRDVTEWARERTRLERQNDRLEAFAGIVSHDLRNPLAVVAGNLELAMREYDGDTLRSARRAVDRMDRLVGDLLLLARRGGTIDAVEPVDLGALAERCWADLETGDATLVLRDPPTVVADEARLEQVLENLFGNAVAHGGESVTVTVGSWESGFFVEDDGRGIEPDRHEMVFEAGYSTATEGTGFGLRIVRDLVEAHGWTVRATTGREGGARFEIAVDGPI